MMSLSVCGISGKSGFDSLTQSYLRPFFVDQTSAACNNQKVAIT